MLANITQILLLLLIVLQILMVIYMMWKSHKEYKRTVEFYNKMDKDRQKAQEDFEKSLDNLLCTTDKECE